MISIWKQSFWLRINHFIATRPSREKNNLLKCSPSKTMLLAYICTCNCSNYPHLKFRLWNCQKQCNMYLINATVESWASCLFTVWIWMRSLFADKMARIFFSRRTFHFAFVERLQHKQPSRRNNEWPWKTPIEFWYIVRSGASVNCFGLKMLRHCPSKPHECNSSCRKRKN